MIYSIGKIKSFNGKQIVFNVCEVFEDIKVCLDDVEGISNVIVNYGNNVYTDEVVKVKLVDKKEADFIFHKVTNYEDADFILNLTSL